MSLLIGHTHVHEVMNTLCMSVLVYVCVCE